MRRYNVSTHSRGLVSSRWSSMTCTGIPFSASISYMTKSSYGRYLMGHMETRH